MSNYGTSKELETNVLGQGEWIIDPGVRDRNTFAANSLQCLIIAHLRWNIILSYMPINAVVHNIHYCR
jgi:hypothetical protein